MKIIIEAEVQEIGDLITTIQDRQNKKTDIEINCDTSEIVKKALIYKKRGEKMEREQKEVIKDLSDLVRHLLNRIEAIEKEVFGIEKEFPPIDLSEEEK